MADDLQLNVNVNVKNAAGGEIKRVASQAAQAFKGTAAEQRKGTSALAAQTSAIKRNDASQRAANNALRAGSAAAAAGLDRQKRAAQDAGKALDGTARSGKQAQQVMQQLGRNNMSGLTSGLNRAMQTMRGMVKTASEVGKGIGQIGAGLTAATMVGARALRNPIDVERRLTALAITAYGDKNDDEFNAGYLRLREGVNNAARIGGGRREDSMDAADILIASGVMEPEDIINMLPTIQKAIVASGASGEDIGNIIVAAVENGFSGVDAEEIGRLLDAAVKGGKLGRAELRHMASSLPMLMSSFQGQKGIEGFASLIASFETAMSSAGSAEQAATNLNAFLSKFNSAELTRSFAEKYGTNWTKSQNAFIEQGYSPQEAFFAVVEEKVLKPNKDYQALQTQLQAAGNDAERKAILERMAEVLQATAIGELMPDIRATRGLVAHMNRMDYWHDTRQQILTNSAGAVDQDHRRASQTTSAKLDQVTTEKDIAQDTMLADVDGVLKSVLSGMTNFAQENPRMATLAMEGSTLFGAGLASQAAGSAFGMFFRRRGAAGAASRAGTAAGLAGAASGVVPVYVTNMNAMPPNAATMGGAAGALGRGAQVMRFMRFAGPAAGAMGLFNGVRLAMDDTMSLRENTAAQVGNVGGTMGALGGAGFGAALGTALAPGIGTVVGGVLGGLLGSFLGEETMQRLAEGQASTIELYTKSVLQLDGKDIAEAVDRETFLNYARGHM